MDRKEHSHGPKGLGSKAARRGVPNTQQPPPFWVLNDIFRYTTEELFSIVAQYATRKEAARPHPVLGSREAVPGSNKVASSSIAVQGARKDAKGGKKRWKCHP
jgi:hypothetical protein